MPFLKVFRSLMPFQCPRTEWTFKGTIKKQFDLLSPWALWLQLVSCCLLPELWYPSYFCPPPAKSWLPRCSLYLWLFSYNLCPPSCSPCCFPMLIFEISWTALPERKSFSQKRNQFEFDTSLGLPTATFVFGSCPVLLLFPPKISLFFSVYWGQPNSQTTCEYFKKKIWRASSLNT